MDRVIELPVGFKSRLLFISFLSLFLTVVVAALPKLGSAATITVNSTAQCNASGAPVLCPAGFIFPGSPVGGTSGTNTCLCAGSDGDGFCSLGEAIIAANTDAAVDGCSAGSGSDVINLTSGATYTLSVVDNSGTGTDTGFFEGTNGLPTVLSDITIDGFSSSTAIQRDYTGGTPEFRIFNTANSGLNHLTLQNLSVKNGKLSGSGCDGTGDSCGGGVRMRGNVFNSRLDLTNVTLADNYARAGGAVSHSVNGTATWSQVACSNNSVLFAGGCLGEGSGAVNIYDSTFSGNFSTAGAGGAIAGEVNAIRTTFFNNSAVFGGAAYLGQPTGNFINCTLDSNTASTAGGAIYYGTGLANLRLANSTVTNNTTAAGSGTVAGGIAGDTFTIRNTIVAANNPAGADDIADIGGSFTDQGYNLIDTTDGSITLAGTDITGANGAGGTQDYATIASLGLEALALNGGLTQNHALKTNSVAVDAGNPAVPGSGSPACESSDQRSITPFPSASASTCDIGSYELDDHDGDTVVDSSDNCYKNANTDQEDSDGDAVAGTGTGGDKCDSSTMNASFGTGSSFHVTTPFYRAKITDSAGSDAGCLEFGMGSGWGGTVSADIGITGSPGTNVVKLCPHATQGLSIDGGSTFLTLDTASPTFNQSVWQAVVFGDATGTDPAFTGASAARTHYGSGANSMGVGHEVMNLAAATGAVQAKWELTLPSGFTVDSSELGGDSIGRLTIENASLTDFYRISPLGCGANGKPTGIEGDCPTGPANSPDSDPLLVDGDLTDDDFFGFTRLIQELQTATAGPPSPNTTTCRPGAPLGGTPETLGIDHRDGVTAATIKTRQEGHGNQSDDEFGTWSVSGAACTSGAGGVCTLTGVCASTFVTRNQGISTRLGIGWKVSALQDQVLATTPPDPDLGATANENAVSSVTGKHQIGFDEEYTATWEGATFTMDNSGPNRFDGGGSTTYALLPNDGKPCDFSDCAQVHTGMGFGGSTLTISGSTLIDFPSGTQGGVGVAMGPGPRVATGDPCITGDPLNTSLDPLDPSTHTGRCKANFIKRGKLSVNGSGGTDTLTINGAMGGLACGESDCTGEVFVAALGDDPNATDQNMRRGHGGIGCAAGRGIGIGWNVLTNETLSNRPISLSDTCLDVGDASCYPTAVIGAGDSNFPAGTGICNMEWNRIDLTAQTDLTEPTGGGFGCSQQFGKCNLGGAYWDTSLTPDGCNFTATFAKSEIKGGSPFGKGFEVGVGISGGANVDPDTGRGLRHDTSPSTGTDPLTTPLPIPPLKACLKNVRVYDSETAVNTGGNSTVQIDHSEMDGCQYSCLGTGYGGANLATVASTTGDTGGPCPFDPSPYGASCKDRGRDFATPQTGKCQNGSTTCNTTPGSAPGGDEDHLAALAAGISAPHSLKVTNTEIGCDHSTLIHNAGQEPVLPAVGSVNSTTFEISCTTPNASLRVADEPACSQNIAVTIGKGADLIEYPSLLTVEILDSNICTQSPGIYVSNVDAFAPLNLDVTDTCMVNSTGTGCVTTGPLIAAPIGGTGATSPTGYPSGGDPQTTSTQNQVTAEVSSEVQCDTGTTSSTTGLGSCAAAFYPSFTGDINTCAGKYDFARLILSQGVTEGIVSNGTKTAATTLLCKSQSASAFPVAPCTGAQSQSQCLNFTHAVEKVTNGKINHAQKQDLMDDTLEDIETQCCL